MDDFREPYCRRNEAVPTFSFFLFLCSLSLGVTTGVDRGVGGEGWVAACSRWRFEDVDFVRPPEGAEEPRGPAAEDAR